MGKINIKWNLELSISNIITLLLLFVLFNFKSIDSILKIYSQEIVMIEDFFSIDNNILEENSKEKVEINDDVFFISDLLNNNSSNINKVKFNTKVLKYKVFHSEILLPPPELV